jgi:hypothetical protein
MRRPWPEFGLTIFAFLLHFAWEMLQVPLYQGMATMAHWDAVLFCTRATVGDVAIALGAFWGTALLVGAGRRWLFAPWRAPVLLFTAFGVTTTAVIEVLSTQAWDRWAYGPMMPKVGGIGLSPLAQWLVLSPLVVYLAQRHLPAGRRWLLPLTGPASPPIDRSSRNVARRAAGAGSLWSRWRLPGAGCWDIPEHAARLPVLDAERRVAAAELAVQAPKVPYPPGARRFC